MTQRPATETGPMSVSTRLAAFTAGIRLNDCPPAALAAVRRAALDTLGVTLAGAGESVARIVRRVVRAEGGIPLCTVFGTRLRASATAAALANGAAGHAHDFDDTNFTLLGHPSVPLLAAALAAAEAEMRGGASVVRAYIAGFEVGAAIGAAVNPAHYARGWHATSTIGSLACTAAAAAVLELDVATTRAAFGLAASLASGLKENFGSMTKPFHAGHAARNGVWAAMLAREGLSASDTALEGTQGYFAAFGAARDLAEALAGLGHRWQLLDSGIAVKPYPSCALTHSAVDALIELRARHQLDADHVAQVEVGVGRVVPDVLIHAEPATALERKFSMQFCAAVALVDGRVDLDTFADGPASPSVEKLMSRVSMVVDPTLPEGRDQQAWSRVTVRLADGGTLACPPRGAQGHPDQPLSEAALRTKFLTCAGRVMSRAEAEAVADQIDALEHIPDIRALTSRLTADAD
jgi:2-methylcitrate dehydratase PrpD